MSLKILQEKFAEYILSNRDDNISRYLSDAVSDGKIQKISALNIYKNNYKQLMVQNLSNIFPTVKKLVGTDFFAQMVINYSLLHPPRTGILLNYGDSFPEYISMLPNLQELPYLSEVALLDWLINLCHHSKANEVNLKNIYNTLVERQDFDQVYFKLLDNVYLLHSVYAVDLIYEFCKKQDYKNTEQLDYSVREANVIVYKNANEVNVQNVTDIAFQFLQLVKAEKTFAETLEILLECQDEQVVINDLKTIFNLPIFAGFNCKL